MIPLLLAALALLGAGGLQHRRHRKAGLLRAAQARQMREDAIQAGIAEGFARGWHGVGRSRW